MTRVVEPVEDVPVVVCATTGTETFKGGDAFLPDVPGAIADFVTVLDFYTRTKKTGGLGYSVARAKTTAAYQGLLKLGGTWNG